MNRTYLPFLASAVLAGCAALTNPSDRDGRTTAETAAVDDTLNVPIGQVRSADGGKLEIRFDAKVADSRCPANVVCVWEGDAHVLIATRGPGGTFTGADLHSALEPRSVVAGGYVISMVGLTPYPGSGDQDAAPVLILRVRRE